MAALRRIQVCRKESPRADFVLTISADEPTLPLGQGFKVNVELKNNSGKDHEIAMFLLFHPRISGEHWIFDIALPPWPSFIFLKTEVLFHKLLI